MAKIIKLTDEYKGDILDKFKKFIEEIKMADGKINFTDTFSLPERKATLLFSEKAWIKMHRLVSHFDKEVAWHGTARRGEDGKDEYIIDDIFVYPQEVTGATVNTDQKEYQEWLYGLEDNVFNNLRMQGHSHVNMGTTPSGVDITHQEKIIEQLDDSMFYIFLIWNKKDERTIKIYDFAKNVLFETADVNIVVLEEDIGIISFIEDADDMVKTKTYTSSYGKQDEKKSTTPSSSSKDNKDSKELELYEGGKRKGRRREEDDELSEYEKMYKYGSGFNSGYPFDY